MKYVDDASNSFDELNRILNNNLEFLNLLDADTELYDYMRDYINKLSDKYRSFVRKNNVPLSKIPDNIKGFIYDDSEIKSK